MRKHEDKLSEALARLKQEGQSQEVPKEIVDETLRRIADCGSQPRIGVRGDNSGDWETARARIRNPPSVIRNLFRLAAAAAVFVLLGYTAGRLSTPKPMSLDQIRDALTPSVAAAIEPAVREGLEDVRHEYQLALAATYVHVKEELTDQYRSDLNRFAVQTLAASNAVTNELLTQLVQAIDTAKAQDLRRITRALYEIEMNRVQDKTQLASGLQTLAYRTEDELSRTKREIAQLLVDVHPAGFDLPSVEPTQTYHERNKP
jgi:DNA primase